MAECEVIVVGGGPVGLCVALLLARKGIEVRLFEKSPKLDEDLRASTFHPPTLDMLDELGLAQPLLARGLVCPDWQIRMHPSGARAVFDLSVLEADTKHPYRMQCEQWKLSEALLQALLVEPKAQVEFGCEIKGVAQSESGVSVAFSDGRAPLGTKFLIGADGAHSVVRKAIGRVFEGETYPETTLLITTDFPFEDHLEGLSNVSYCWKAGGNFSLLKVPGRWRISIYPREDMDVESQLSDDHVEQSLQAIVPRTQSYDIIERRPYRVHQRIVANYVEGRVALVGDAAHLNAPSGGMGLNGGIHDAFELARAFGDILRNSVAHGPRLALYDRRRRPIAKEQILTQADANRARMRERDDAKRGEILAQLQAITADRDKLHAHLLRSSMIEGLRLSEAVR